MAFDESRSEFGRHWQVAALIALALVMARGQVALSAEILSFQAWRGARIEEARAHLEKLQAQSGVASVAKRPEALKSDLTGGRLQSGGGKALRSDSKLQQAQTNLELAQELTVNDYFVLYLNQLRGREAFIEAAKKFSSEDAADLMLAYQKHLAAGGVGYEELAPSAAGFAASIRGRSAGPAPSPSPSPASHTNPLQL